MIAYDLEKLIFSLSASEKKHFQLYSSKQTGPKDYLLLYDLALDKRNSHQGLDEQFRETYPKKSFENTATYLFRVLTDVLVQIRIEQDPWYAQHHYLLKARLCSERSMPSRARKMLSKAYNLASKYQNHSVAYQALRMELTASADLGFPKVNEQNLVDMQMKARLTLQSLRQLQEHYSLYELLSYRLTKGARALDEKSDKKTNDLILSELSLTTRGSQFEFEPQKLHLLFQSFFFIRTGEYRSALRIFNELNKLFEANKAMWDFPPYDYLSTLEGILDSLRSIGYYHAMAKFIDQTETLGNGDYPEHFRTLAILTANTYRLNMFLGTGQGEVALRFLTDHGKDKSTLNNPERHENQLEYEYFESLTYFLTGQLNKAKKKLSSLLSAEKQHKQLLVYRVSRLLHIVISYEQDDLDYLEYEIRSYKRTFSKMGKGYKTEKFVFNTIASDPKRRGNSWKETYLKRKLKHAEVIKGEKRERSLLKYYDFTSWAINNFR